MARIKVEDWLTEDSLKKFHDWAAQGYTDKEIYQGIGISKATFYKWLRLYPQITEAIKKGREPVLIKIEESFINQSCLEHHVVEQQIIDNPDGTQTKVKRTKVIPAKAGAQIFYLKNQWPERWRDPKENQVIEKLKLENEKLKIEVSRLKEEKKEEETFRYKGIPADLIAPTFLKLHHAIRNKEYTEYLLPGGRGSTKSSVISLEIVHLIMLNPNMHAVVTRSVGDRLKTTVYNQIKWAINVLGLQHEFEYKKNPLEIIRKSTGQTIYFRGAAEPEDLKSIKPEFGYIGILWYEELNQFRGPNSVDNVRTSVIRGGDDAYIFKSYNPPKNNTNWVNRYRNQPMKGRMVVESNYLDVPKDWLGQAFLDLAETKKETNPMAYRHEYLGEVTGTGADVFDNLEIREITDEEIKRYDHIHYGLDFGFIDPTAFVKFGYDPNTETLIFIDEFVATKTPIEVTAEEIKKRLDSIYDYIVCDSADPMSIDKLCELGINAYPAKKGAGSRNSGYRYLSGRNKIIIDPSRTPVVYEEFTSKEYERDKDENIIEGYPDGNDHTIDATRYGAEDLVQQSGIIGVW